jgi:CBS domain-containing protein
LIPVAAAPLRLVDLGGALLVGLACGLSARLFVAMYRAAIRRTRAHPFGARAAVGGAVVAPLGAVSLAAFHRLYALGPGYEPILKAARGQIGAWLLVALIAMKMVATTATAAGNGVGGLFFPSVLMGAALGGAMGHVLPGPPSLFAVVGMAAFLGGAYKVPLAGVAFVAETTGAPGYIIPGLVAAAIAYIASGRDSLSHRQRYRRIVDIDTRLDVNVSSIMSKDWVEVPVSAMLDEVATRYAIAARSRTIPVVEDGRYAGMISLSSLGDVPSDRWAATPVTAVLSPNHPTVAAHDKLRDALARMRRSGVERAAVLEDRRIIGTLAASDVLRLEEVIDTVADEERRGREA